jgi:H+/Na+-translocating ferredoxin:NAD+ oxidoreductase subunit G
VEEPRNDTSAGSGSGFKNSNLAQAWLVLLLALGFGIALAAVQVNLSGVIAANKLNETLDKAPELVLGARGTAESRGQSASVEVSPGSLTVNTGAKTVSYPIYRVSRGGTLAGWVLKAGGQGYADKVELLLGLDPGQNTITGLFILEQKETPGLGANIITPGWRNQFIAKSTATPLVVKKGGAPRADAIDAITGATISSRSVTAIVNRTIADVKGRLTPENIQMK